MTAPTAAPEVLELLRPDDWHVHLRDGELLESVVGFTARQFGRAIVMPNLKPPITTAAAAKAYRDRIRRAVDPALDFTPLMTAYLTDDADPAELARGFEEGVFTAAKLYPAHATTNSAAGVTDLRRLDSVLAELQRLGMPLLVHGEVVDHRVDVFDREAVFLERVLAPTLARFPELRVVVEHITTREAVAFVTAAGPSVAATITPHHLEVNRNAMFDGGLRPHFYCLPVAKREVHRLALRAAATSGNPKFFLGTDSAPHRVADKESACGCAGIFNAPYALESYAKTFEEEGALDKLEGFASVFGPRFYRLPVNRSRVRLVRATAVVPERCELKAGVVVPFHAGQSLPWRFEGLAG